MEDSKLLSKLKEYRISNFYFHVSYILENYLEKWVIRIIDKNYQFFNDHLSVIIENRPNKLLRFCILNTLIMTGLKMKVLLFTTKDKIKEMNALLSDIKEFIDIKCLSNEKYGYEEMNVLSYNRVLKNPLFWRELSAENILIFQTDSLLIQPLDFSMFKYDYVGAPFSKDKYASTSFPVFEADSDNEITSKWVTQIFNRVVEVPEFVGQGNGGLSLRNRDLMREICEKECSNDDENEDIYFSRLVPKYSHNLAPLEIARRFSCECDYLKTIGFHASFLYISNEKQAEIYERHLKYIMSLTD